MSLQSKQPLRFEINSLRRLGVRLLYRLRIVPSVTKFRNDLSSLCIER